MNTETLRRIDPISARAYGEEPTPGEGDVLGTVTNVEMIRYLNWYNYFQDGTDARKYVIAGNADIDPAAIKRIPENELCTMGWVFRLVARGFNVEDATVAKQRTKLVALIAKHAEIEVEEEFSPVRKKLSVADKKANAEWVIKYYEKNDLKSPIRAEMIKNAEKVLGINQIKIRPGAILIAPLPADPLRKPRKARARKVIPTNRIVARLQHKKVDAELNIKSVSPAEIVGSVELWTFNTETRFLYHFVAEPNSVMSVKGTTIIGFDTKRSNMKKVRKPDVFFPAFMAAGKKSKLPMYMGIKAVPASVKGRTGGDTLLLKAVK